MSIITAIIGSMGNPKAPDPGGAVSSFPSIVNNLRRSVYTGYHYEDPLYSLGKVPDSVTYSPIIDISETGDNFTVEWTGWFKAPSTGNYQFSTTSDDGSYFWIGLAALDPTLENVNVDNGNLHGNQTELGSHVALTADLYYPIRILFGEMSGGQTMDVYFQLDSDPTHTPLTSYVYSEDPESNIISNALVTLDAANTSSYSGSGTIWYNLGSASANATLDPGTVNPPTWSNDFGGMFTFDRTQYQYTKIPTLGTLNNYTVSGWIRYTSIPSSGACLITEGYVGTEINFAIGNILDGTDVSGGVFNQENSTWYKSGGEIPTLNKWLYYTLTWDGTNILFYINGKYFSGTTTSEVITSSGQPIYIGVRWDNLNLQPSYINGNISVINIYNTCFNAAQVAHNFNYYKYRYGLDHSLVT